MGEFNVRLYLAAISVNFITFGAGTAFSWPSPVLPQLKSPDSPLGAPITPLEESWIASFVNLGCIVGPFAAGYSSDKFGRKKALLIFAVPMIVSYLMTAFATNIIWYYLARFLLGIGASCVFAIVPLYLGEIAEDGNRGLLGCLFCVVLVSGSFFAYVLGPFVSIMVLSLGCAVPFLVFMVVFGVFMPESPYWYAMVEHETAAEAALKNLRTTSNAAISKELQAIVRNVETSRNSLSFRELFRSKGLIKGLVISLGLMVFQQFAGISVILAYMQSIFDATGSKISPEISAMVIGAMQILISFLTSQLVDRLGRRVLLLVSMLGLCLSTGTIGGYFFIQSTGVDLEAVFWLPIASLIVYMFSYNFGIGPLAWAMMGELFPAEAKAIAAPLATTFCFVVAFLTTVLFPFLFLALGMGVSFWIFTVACVIGAAFVWVYVPETKGRSLLEIQDDLAGKSKL